MKKSQFDKLDMKTNDLTQENIAKISSLFPNLITEVEKDGKVIKTINADKLKEVVGDYATSDSEVYELTWVGKQESKQKIVAPITKTLRPIPEDSVDFENTENLYIEGDNFEVLKVLQESYLNKVKMIYIDPPYNTGKDFVYKDNFKVSKEEYDEESGAIDEDGNKLFLNTTTNGRFHSDWLSMIYERLVLAKDLLKDEGVIFISIDDNEAANLKKICDELFSEGNFIADITVVNNLKGRSDKRYIATANERLLMYVKSDAFEESGLQLTKEILEEFKEEDTLGKYRLLGLRKRGGADTRKERPKMYFPLFINPETREVSVEKGCKFTIEVLPKKSDGSEGCWRWGRDTVQSRIKSLVGKPISGTGRHDIFEKDYLETDGEIRRLKPKSVMSGTNYSTDGATKSFKALFPEVDFNNPKPVPFIKDLVSYATVVNSNDIVLDFFSGSSTTAHAILELNNEDGGNRKFIMVQLPEKTAADSKAYKAGYKNICEIGKERIRRAAKKIKEELKEKSKQSKLSKEKANSGRLDFGFRVFRLDSSNMKNVYYNPTEMDQRTLTNFKDNIKEDRTDKDLLYQVLLDLAVPISAKVEEQKVKNKTIYKVNENFLIACFDEDIDLDLVKEIAKLNPLRLVFKDSSFKDDSAKVNADEYLKHKLPGCIVRVI